MLVVHDAQKYATFKGNVKAVQGTTTLRSRELDVHYVGAAATAWPRVPIPQGQPRPRPAPPPAQGMRNPSGVGLGANNGTQISKIEARGEVVITSDQDQTTTSDWALYDVPAQLVTVGGNVVLMQGKNVLKGDRLVIDLKTGESRFENRGNTAGGRIRALFMPKEAKPGDDSSKSDTSSGGKSAEKSADTSAGSEKAAAPLPLPLLSPRPTRRCRCFRARRNRAGAEFQSSLSQLVPQLGRERVVGKLLSFPGRQAVAERGVAQPEEHGYEHDAEPNPYAGWLTVHSVVKAFKKRTVVRGVSLEVARGEAVGLLGPNGAGKTTVFYMITGLIPADEGSHPASTAATSRKLPMYQRAPARHRLSAAGGLDLPRAHRRGEHSAPCSRRSSPTRPSASCSSTRCSTNSASRACAGRRPPSRSPAASGAASKLPARSRRRPSFMLLDEPFAGIDPIAVGDIQRAGAPSHRARHRRAHHRPQCARDARSQWTAPTSSMTAWC